MLEPATPAERFVFGRPLDAVHDRFIHLVPRPLTALLGRAAIAAIFLVSGAAKLIDTAGTAAHMSGAGIPYPEALAMIGQNDHNRVAQRSLPFQHRDDVSEHCVGRGQSTVIQRPVVVVRPLISPTGDACDVIRPVGRA